MNQTLSIKTGYEYLLEYFEDYDYRKPKFPKEQLSYRHPKNLVGHQQRTFIIFHCIEMYKRLEGKCLGLEPGAGQAPSPWCVSMDYYCGDNHPVYGGSYQPNVKARGEVLPFKNEVFDFIVSHHSLEHMRDTEKTLREWLRVLKNGGRIAIVMPDKRYGPFGDSSHVSECTPQEFGNVLKRIKTINIIEMDSLKNHFSFNAVIEKLSDRGEIMEKGSTEEIKLREQMRTLWQDRVMWTRMLMISITAGLDGEVDNIHKILRKNQDDIGDALKPYLEKYLFCWDNIPGDDSALLSEFLFQSFGINWIKTAGVVTTLSSSPDKNTIVVKSNNNSVSIRLNDERTRATMELDISGKPHEFKFNATTENGRLNIYLDNSESRNMLTTLLKNNITMSKNFIKAKKAGDTSMDLDAEESLKANAISTAAFLSGLNPNWSHKVLETMLLDYINLLREETIAHLNKNSDTDLAAHEKIQKHALIIADALTAGFVKLTTGR